MENQSLSNGRTGMFIANKGKLQRKELNDICHSGSKLNENNGVVVKTFRSVALNFKN